jgi:Cu+-exporting ATPase
MTKLTQPVALEGVSFRSGHGSKRSTALEMVAPNEPKGRILYTCPMHPEVQQDHPGECPKCGMTLEPKTAVAGTDDEKNAELRDMTRRFWIATR